MGADIYLNSIFKPNNENMRPKIDKLLKDYRASAENLGEDHETTRTIRQEYEDAFEKAWDRGYFRDSYNTTSLFWLLGLSWWAIADEKIPGHDDLTFIDSERMMQPNACRAMKQRIESIDFDVKFTEWVASQKNKLFASKFDDENNSVEKWKEMFSEKRKNFLALLDEAIALNEPLYCSI